MSPDVQRFLHALEALCPAHQLCLAVSGQDALQIWRLYPGEDPIQCHGIEDWTTPEEPSP